MFLCLTYIVIMVFAIARPNITAKDYWVAVATM